jgi:hypothetical protein
VLPKLLRPLFSTRHAPFASAARDSTPRPVVPHSPGSLTEMALLASSIGVPGPCWVRLPAVCSSGSGASGPFGSGASGRPVAPAVSLSMWVFMATSDGPPAEGHREGGRRLLAALLTDVQDGGKPTVAEPHRPAGPPTGFHERFPHVNISGGPVSTSDHHAPSKRVLVAVYTTQLDASGPCDDARAGRRAAHGISVCVYVAPASVDGVWQLVHTLEPDVAAASAAAAAVDAGTWTHVAVSWSPQTVASPMEASLWLQVRWCSLRCCVK